MMALDQHLCDTGRGAEVSVNLKRRDAHQTGWDRHRPPLSMSVPLNPVGVRRFLNNTMRMVAVEQASPRN
jgi:hypothetical protein